jgi:hypothetical protein
MEFRQLSSDHSDQVMGLEKELFGNEAWSKKTMLSEFVAPHSFYVGEELAGLWFKNLSVERSEVELSNCS